MAHILILEDDPDLVSSFSDIIRAFSSHVPIGCHSVEELIAKKEEVLKAKKAFLDVNLGPSQPTGLDAYKWLQENGFSGDIYFLSGHGKSHPFVEEASKVNDVPLLSKPIKVEAFLKIIEEGES